MTGAGPTPTVDPQARDLPLDAHLHTDRSADSDVPIDVYAAAAVERRIAELAITDHVDFDPGLPEPRGPTSRNGSGSSAMPPQRWGPLGVTIRHGLEVSYESRREAEIREHLAGHAYDFVIGSVHVGPDSPYHACQGDGLGRRSVARRGRRAVLRRGPGRRGERPVRQPGPPRLREAVPLAARHAGRSAPSRMDLYDPILRALVESGTGLEVNTSGLRQAAGETYPAPAVVARFHELGGRRVSAGSDAHRADWFAHGLEAGYRAVADAGYDRLAFRRGAERVEIPLPGRFDLA